MLDIGTDGFAALADAGAFGPAQASAAAARR
jgi:hypothetical protein